MFNRKEAGRGKLEVIEEQLMDGSLLICLGEGY